jgi:hypothetical protein
MRELAVVAIASKNPTSQGVRYAYTKGQEALEKLRDGFHWSSPSDGLAGTKIIYLGDQWNQPSIPLRGISRAQPLAIFSPAWIVGLRFRSYLRPLV